MIIGENIKKARRNMNLTQEEFAFMLGISRSNLSDMENGRNKVGNLNLLVKISKLSQKPIEYFMREKSSNFNERLLNYRINEIKIDSKREMAKKIGISEQLYAMVERGDRKPSKDFLNKLVLLSNLKEEYWIYGISEDNIYSKKIEYCLRNKENNLLCKHILQMLDDINID
ncbi:TPA: helix-turn-helix domain-containing protein [Clostridium botulinum]|nr:helix-turn-helix domain-containing protein [Clostridium botulinum]